MLNQIHELTVKNGKLNFAGEYVKYSDFDNGIDQTGAPCVVLAGETESYLFEVYFPSDSDFWKIENPDALDVVKYYAYYSWYPLN